MNVPTRALASVLRERLADTGPRVIVGRVVSAPDSRHVVVNVAGTNVTVAKLASYAAPVAGDSCFVLVDSYFSLALGTCK